MKMREWASNWIRSAKSQIESVSHDENPLIVSDISEVEFNIETNIWTEIMLLFRLKMKAKYGLILINVFANVSKDAISYTVLDMQTSN